MIFHRRGTGGRERGADKAVCLSVCLWGWRKVRHDIGASLSEGDLGVFCNNRRQGKRAMQSAGTKMAFHLHFSSFYHIHTCPRWQRLASSNTQDFKRDKHLCSFNLPILVFRNGPASVSVLGLFLLELPAIFFVSVFFPCSQSSQNISHPFMMCQIQTMLLINGT